MNKIPVLIAARNEEAYIGECLDSLSPAKVEPIVIVNDSNDSTADIARNSGAETIVTETPGKLPALQLGMKNLGNRALDGFLVLDADSAPLFPKRWATAMARTDNEDTPLLVGGSVLWKPNKLSLPYNFAVTAKYEMSARLRESPPVPEANLFIKPNTTETVDELLNLEHVYPGEGRAICKAITSNGGTYQRSLDPRTFAWTSDRFLRSFNELKSQRDQPDAWLETYSSRAPAGSRVPHELF